MNKKFKNIIGIIGFILLFAFVVYMKTERKLKRTGVIKPDNTEEVNSVIEFSKQQQQNTFEQAQDKERQERDSLRQIQKEKMDEQLKKAQEIMKELDKEIEESK